MMSTVRTSKNSSGNASNSDRNDDNAITEEELKEKGTAITVNDVLRLAKATKSLSHARRESTVQFSRSMF